MFCPGSGTKQAQRRTQGLKDRASERRSVPMTDQSQGSTSIPAVESYSHRGNPAFEAEMALIGPKSNMRAFPLHDRKNSSLTKAGIQKSHPFPIEEGHRK
jgi:hypothetical protein